MDFVIISVVNDNQLQVLMGVGRLQLQIQYNRVSMKNRLARIKTAVDEEGNYDQAEYLREQKNVYKREIDFVTRVDAITEQQFELRPLEIGFLNSAVLKDDQKFKDIKKIMTDYNKAILERGGAATNGVHLKKVVMEAMVKFMSLMMLAPDADIAHHWFMKHLDPKSSNKSTKELMQEIKQIVVEKQLLPIDIINRELILNTVNEQLHPYRVKARTMYRELDDPRIELQNYNTHKLEFINEHLMKQHEAKDKQKKKWIETVKFPKIEPLQYSIEDYPEDKKQEPIKPSDMVATNTDTQKTQAAQPPADGQPVQLDAEGKPIPQENTNDQQQQDLDFGQPAEADPEPDEPEQEEDKKKGKLDPLLKIFILERMRAKQKQDAACNKIRERQENKKNTTYEEDIFQGNYIRDWAKQRARLKTQIARRNQSMRGVEKRVRGKDENMTANTFIENDIDRIRVESTIQEYKKHITTVEMPPDRLNFEAGQSLYDRRRVKTQAPHKPFSSILTDYSRKVQENAMADEISNIKQKFAKYKVYGPMDKLIKGLAPPDWEYVDDSDKIVWPNSQMLSNPFMKVAKKKKKKKKK